jgi:hypothetical protein
MEFVTRPNGRVVEKGFDEERRVVRVVPKNDQLRKYLKHPSRGALNAEGSTEWPNDQFTRRRIKAGDVTVEEATAREAKTDKVIDKSGAKAAGSTTDEPPRGDPSVDPSKTSAPKAGKAPTTNPQT